MRASLVVAVTVLACAGISAGVALGDGHLATGQATADPVPDLSGVWTNLPRGSRELRSQFFTGRELLPMTVWGREQYASARPGYGPRAVMVSDSTDPVYRCYPPPPGLPRIYFHPMPMEIVQQQDRILMLFEHDSIVRHIWLDHHEAQPSERIPTYMGRSTGRWEGDTLVVETDTFNGKTWLDRVGHPASDAMRVVERIRRTDSATLQIDVVVHDPVAYITPLEDRFVYRLEPAWRIAEHACADFQ